MDILLDLIASFDPDNPTFRPTEIYNEGWLLKALLHQLSKLELDTHPLSFTPGATWFSEALLPSVFKARYRGDPLAESRTNADGVVGHFQIGTKAKADLALNPDAQQFVVVEAKIGSRLSAGTRNAPDFDQAARNVACMAEVLQRAGRTPADVARLAFIVLAPQAAIAAGAFAREMDLDSIRSKVQHRVESYNGEKDGWFQEWFLPAFDAMSLQTLSWETAVAGVRRADPATAASLADFYEACLAFN